MFKLKNKLMMGGGMGGGMMGGSACFIYPQGAQPALATNIPDITFERQVYMAGSVTMGDGNSVIVWGFNGQNVAGAGSNNSGGGMMGGGMGGMGGGPFPSVPMRLKQGDIAHTRLNVGGMMWKHTIHHHGIEPEYRSDGVGHTSWDISSSYTYQWSPQHAGTYFYHCHTNTVLHAEMGMYGVLIVDPPSGPGTAYVGGPAYDVEAIWAVDEIDSSWHKSASNWPAGTCGGDVGLNTLNPDYFIISGLDGTKNTPVANARTAYNDPTVAVTMNLGQTLLVRYINAGYLPQRMRLPAGLTGTVVASDGRPLPKPIPVDDTSIMNTVAAERYDIIIKPSKAGVFEVAFDIQHWITGKTLGTATTTITVV